MYLSDTFSRAFLHIKVNAYNFSNKLEAVDHKEHLSVIEEWWQHINYESAGDSIVQQLWATILQGWPESWSDMPECLYPYFDHQEIHAVEDELVFKS